MINYFNHYLTIFLVDVKFIFNSLILQNKYLLYFNYYQNKYLLYFNYYYDLG